MQAQVWNAAGAIARMLLLATAVYLMRERPIHIGTLRVRVHAWLHLGTTLSLTFRLRPVLQVAAWWFAEDAMVAGCSIGFMLHPWYVPVGHAQCSALMQFDIGQIGLVVISCLVFLLPANSCSYER